MTQFLPNVMQKIDTILYMFGLKNSSDIVMVPMQQQSGGNDCGVFAIASLVFNDDPIEITYQQASLQFNVFQVENLLLFQVYN